MTRARRWQQHPRWEVRQGSSTFTCYEPTHALALASAGRAGFPHPDTCRMIEEAPSGQKQGRLI